MYWQTSVFAVPRIFYQVGSVYRDKRNEQHHGTKTGVGKEKSFKGEHGMRIISDRST